MNYRKISVRQWEKYALFTSSIFRFSSLALHSLGHNKLKRTSTNRGFWSVRMQMKLSPGRAVLPHMAKAFLCHFQVQYSWMDSWQNWIYQSFRTFPRVLPTTSSLPGSLHPKLPQMGCKFIARNSLISPPGLTQPRNSQPTLLITLFLSPSTGNQIFRK